MSITESTIERLDQLLAEAQRLRYGNQYGQADEAQAQRCYGWLGAAENLVELMVPNPNSAYRKAISRLDPKEYGAIINQAVGEVAETLANLKIDAQSGLLSSIADSVRAEVFDDFLDHAKHYAKNGSKKQSGVIVGVVFEDSVRSVCRKLSIDEAGKKLDQLISAIAKTGKITSVKAKRARAAADLRTSATHARWDEYELTDVETTIKFTEEFIDQLLDG